MDTAQGQGRWSNPRVTTGPVRPSQLAFKPKGWLPSPAEHPSSLNGSNALKGEEEASGKGSASSWAGEPFVWERRGRNLPSGKPPFPPQGKQCPTGLIVPRVAARGKCLLQQGQKALPPPATVAAVTSWRWDSPMGVDSGDQGAGEEPPFGWSLPQSC